MNFYLEFIYLYIYFLDFTDPNKTDSELLSFSLFHGQQDKF